MQNTSLRQKVNNLPVLRHINGSYLGKVWQNSRFAKAVEGLIYRVNTAVDDSLVTRYAAQSGYDFKRIRPDLCGEIDPHYFWTAIRAHANGVSLSEILETYKHPVDEKRAKGLEIYSQLLEDIKDIDDNIYRRDAKAP